MDKMKNNRSKKSVFRESHQISPPMLQKQLKVKKPTNQSSSVMNLKPMKDSKSSNRTAQVTPSRVAMMPFDKNKFENVYISGSEPKMKKVPSTVNVSQNKAKEVQQPLQQIPMQIIKNEKQTNKYPQITRIIRSTNLIKNMASNNSLSAYEQTNQSKRQIIQESPLRMQHKKSLAQIQQTPIQSLMTQKSQMMQIQKKQSRTNDIPTLKSEIQKSQQNNGVNKRPSQNQIQTKEGGLEKNREVFKAKKKTMPVQQLANEHISVDTKSRQDLNQTNNDPFGYTLRSPIAVEMKNHSSNAIEIRPSEGHPKKNKIGMSKQRNFIHINTFQNHQQRHKMDSINSNTKTPQKHAFTKPEAGISLNTPTDLKHMISKEEQQDLTPKEKQPVISTSRIVSNFVDETMDDTPHKMVTYSFQQNPLQSIKQARLALKQKRTNIHMINKQSSRQQNLQQLKMCNMANLTNTQKIKKYNFNGDHTEDDSISLMDETGNIQEDLLNENYCNQEDSPFRQPLNHSKSNNNSQLDNSVSSRINRVRESSITKIGKQSNRNKDVVIQILNNLSFRHHQQQCVRDISNEVDNETVNDGSLKPRKSEIQSAMKINRNKIPEPQQKVDQFFSFNHNGIDVTDQKPAIVRGDESKSSDQQIGESFDFSDLPNEQLNAYIQSITKRQDRAGLQMDKQHPVTEIFEAEPDFMMDDIIRANDTARINSSNISGRADPKASAEISIQSHARQETLLLNDASQLPMRSQKFQEYSHLKDDEIDLGSIDRNTKAQALGSSFNKYGYPLSNSTAKNHIKPHHHRKTSNLSQFSASIGNKFSLRLQNLTSVKLSNFQGKTNLTHVDLRNNKLFRLSDEILPPLILLRELRLDYNYLSELPYGIHRLHHISILTAGWNRIKKIDSEVFQKNSSIQHLQLNDNRLTKLPYSIGNLQKLKTLFLHNNKIFSLPSTLGNLILSSQVCTCRSLLSELSLDWLLYFPKQAGAQMVPSFKSLKGYDRQVSLLKNSEMVPTEAVFSQGLIDSILILCQYKQILEKLEKIESQKQLNYQNPQQDDFYEVQINAIQQSLNSQDRPKNTNSKFSGSVNFIEFLMFFYRFESIRQLTEKDMMENKNIKLSHMICLLGHQYLMKGTLDYLCNISEETNDQTLDKFINATDMDYSTPLVYAIKSRNDAMTTVLMANQKLFLNMNSTKYGTALHVALDNKDNELAKKIIRKLKTLPDYYAQQDLTKLDEDGNEPLHIVMKNFNDNIKSSRQLARLLIREGANTEGRNRFQNTPLARALNYGQNEAVRFALEHNYQIRNNKKYKQLNSFDFNEVGGKLKFTAMHVAVYQNNFELIQMLLESEEPFDLEIKDSEDRCAIDLCYSISAIFKTLRRAMDKQRMKRFSANDGTFLQSIQDRNIDQNVEMSHNMVSRRHRIKNSKMVNKKRPENLIRSSLVQQNTLRNSVERSQSTFNNFQEERQMLFRNQVQSSMNIHGQQSQQRRWGQLSGAVRESNLVASSSMGRLSQLPAQNSIQKDNPYQDDENKRQKYQTHTLRRDQSADNCNYKQQLKRESAYSNNYQLKSAHVSNQKVKQIDLKSIYEMQNSGLANEPVDRFDRQLTLVSGRSSSDLQSILITPKMVCHTQDDVTPMIGNNRGSFLDQSQNMSSPSSRKPTKIIQKLGHRQRNHNSQTRSVHLTIDNYSSSTPSPTDPSMSSGHFESPISSKQMSQQSDSETSLTEQIKNPTQFSDDSEEVDIFRQSQNQIVKKLARKYGLKCHLERHLDYIELLNEINQKMKNPNQRKINTLINGRNAIDAQQPVMIIPNPCYNANQIFQTTSRELLNLALIANHENSRQTIDKYQSPQKSQLDVSVEAHQGATEIAGNNIDNLESMESFIEDENVPANALKTSRNYTVTDAIENNNLRIFNSLGKNVIHHGEEMTNIQKRGANYNKYIPITNVSIPDLSSLASPTGTIVPKLTSATLGIESFKSIPGPLPPPSDDETERGLEDCDADPDTDIDAEPTGPSHLQEQLSHLALQNTQRNKMATLKNVQMQDMNNLEDNTESLMIELGDTTRREETMLQPKIETLFQIDQNDPAVQLTHILEYYEENPDDQPNSSDRFRIRCILDHLYVQKPDKIELQKLIDLSKTSVLKNQILYELHNLRSSTQANTPKKFIPSETSWSTEFMKQKPSMAKTSKPGSKQSIQKLNDSRKFSKQNKSKERSLVKPLQLDSHHAPSLKLKKKISMN